MSESEDLWTFYGEISSDFIIYNRFIGDIAVKARRLRSGIQLEVRSVMVNEHRILIVGVVENETATSEDTGMAAGPI